MLDCYDYALRNFLEEKEVRVEGGGDIVVWAVINFSDLEELCDLLDEYDMAELENNCTLRKGYIALELNALIDINKWDYEFIKKILSEHDAVYYEHKLRKEFG